MKLQTGWLLLWMVAACSRGSDRPDAGRKLAAGEELPEPDIGSAEEAQSPPVRYEIKLGNTVMTALEGKPTRLTGSFDDPTLTVRTLEFRQFRRRGVSFNYPAYYTYEAEMDEPANWTLSGNNFKILVFDRQPEELGQIAAETLAQFDSDEDTTPKKLKLNGIELNGLGFKMKIAGHVHFQEIYRIPGSRQQILMLLDSPGENETDSAERRSTMAELERSFKASN